MKRALAIALAIVCMPLAVAACGESDRSRPPSLVDAAAPIDAPGALDAGGLDAPSAPGECAALPATVPLGTTGSATDTVAAPTRRIVLMGGGSEDDAAARAFVEGAAGGDVLVLRASGSTETYLPYFASDVGADPAAASVSVLRTDDPAAGGDPAVVCRVDAAEAVWLAGGDQWAYLGLWPGALHEALARVSSRGAAIGGTSAGAMALGSMAFDARAGSVTSDEALAAPTAAAISVTASPFAPPELGGWLVDTHFTQRGREGRLLVFLAHVRAGDPSRTAWGLGLDEGCALSIDASGFRVSGPAGTAAWAYEVTSTPVLSKGAPLTLSGVRRVRLDPGTTGAWPVDLGAFAGTASTIDVEAGVVTVH